MEKLESTAVQKLRNYAAQGYLFHGSGNPNIEALEPRKTEDIGANPNPFNSDTAVFATDHLPSPIIFGVIGDQSYLPKSDRRPWYTGWSSYDHKNFTIKARVPLSLKEAIEQRTGYVYVLRPDNFTERLAIQAKSKSIEVPVEIIEVTLQDYVDMGGEIQWTE